MCDARSYTALAPLPSAKEALLQAATDVFSQQRFADVHIAAIAQRAGMSKANVYNHFRDKDQLFLEAHKRHVMAELHRLGAELETQADLAGKIGTIAREIQEAAHHPLRRLPPDLCERALSSPDLREDLQSVRAEIHQWLAARFRAMVGDAGNPLLDMVVPLFVSFMVMFYPIAILFEPELQQPAMLPQYLEHLLRSCKN